MSKDPLSEEILSRIFKTDLKNPDRLTKREDKNHEFKESFNVNNMALYLKTMSAFANNDGGYLIFGVKDRPRLLLGLNDKSLQQFNELPVEKLTELLNEYFSPSIDWEPCVFKFKGKNFGIFYIYPLQNKPAICKKSHDSQNNKYALKEADIYYRYSGRSERIKYAELIKIIEEKRRKEEKQWLHFLMKAARIGVENASVIDIDKGQILEGGNRIVIDEELLGKIRFIKEGQFVEKAGSPTLRLIGDIQTIETGRVLYSGTKKVVKAIEQTDIIETFLRNDIVDNPIEYIKKICSSTTGYLPVYYYIALANLSRERALEIINDTVARGQAKKLLYEKIKNFTQVKQKFFPNKETATSIKRQQFAKYWIEKQIPKDISSEDIKPCINSVTYLSSDDVLRNLVYLKERLLELYKMYYETADSNLASVFREVFCYIDSVEYFCHVPIEGNDINKTN